MSLKNLVAGVEDTDCLQSFPMSIHILSPAPLVSKAFWTMLKKLIGHSPIFFELWGLFEIFCRLTIFLPFTWRQNWVQNLLSFVPEEKLFIQRREREWFTKPSYIGIAQDRNYIIWCTIYQLISSQSALTNEKSNRGSWKYKKEVFIDNLDLVSGDPAEDGGADFGLVSIDIY